MLSSLFLSATNHLLAQGFGVGEPRPIDEIASVSVADLLAG